MPFAFEKKRANGAKIVGKEQGPVAQAFPPAGAPAYDLVFCRKKMEKAGCSGFLQLMPKEWCADLRRFP